MKVSVVALVVYPKIKARRKIANISLLVTKDPEMSKKGEGSPDTAKSQGTISVNRPTQVIPTSSS